jgi:hypothetical protein
MCTQMRVAPSSRRSAEIASSKSRAVAGSIVNVGRPVRSRRTTSRSGPALRACLAARSTAGSKRRRSPRSSMSASSTSAATSGRPRLRSTLACPPARVAGRTSTRSPRLIRESRSSTIRLPGAKYGSATRKRPRLSTVATIPSAAGGSRCGRELFAGAAGECLPGAAEAPLRDCGAAAPLRGGRGPGLAFFAERPAGSALTFDGFGRPWPRASS